jgi:hypothetical protein
VLESDRANLVQRLEAKGLDKSVLSAVILDIKKKMASKRYCSARKI